MNKRQNRPSSEINIGFIHNHDTFRISRDDIFHLFCRQIIPGRRIGIRKYNAAVLPEVIFRADMKIFIERLCLIGNAEHIRPDIVKRIGNVREKYLFPAVEKGQEAHGEHIIGAYPDEYLIRRHSEVSRKRICQALRRRIRILSKLSGIHP